MERENDDFTPLTRNSRDIYGQPLTPGKNVDALNIEAGMAMLHGPCGYEPNPERDMVIEYALRRHARGEEPQAERGAIDQSFHGINFTSWRMVLAAAMANHPLNQGKQDG